MKVFLIAAISLDGFIAQSPEQISTAWTSGADKKWFNKRTKEAGVMVMGRKTQDTIRRALPRRLSVVMTRDEKSKTKNEKLEMITCESVKSNIKGEVVFVNDEPESILKKLEEKGFDEVAICGGASIYSLFMKRGLVDRLHLTVEPVLFGKGVSLFSENLKREGDHKDSSYYNLKLISEKKLNERGTRMLELEVES